MSGFSVFRLKIDTLPVKKVYRVVQVFLSIIKLEAHRLVKSESKILCFDRQVKTATNLFTRTPKAQFLLWGTPTCRLLTEVKSPRFAFLASTTALPYTSTPTLRARSFSLTL